METQAIIPQPTGNPILDNPTLKAAFMAAQGGAQGGAQQPPQPQGAIMPPAGQQPPPQISLPDAPAPTPSPAKQPVVFGPFGQTSGPVAQRGTQEGDKQERERLLSTGSGLSQIHSRIESAMPNHPILGKVLGIGAQGLATLGDIGLSLTGPGQIAESMIPGTAGHHAAQLRQANQALTQDEANAEKEAQAQNLKSEVPLHAAQAGYYGAHAEAIGNHQVTPEEAAAMGNPDLAGSQMDPKAWEQLIKQHGINTTKEDTAKPIQGADGAMYRLDPNNPGVGIPLTTPDGKPIAGTPKPVDMKKQLQNGVVDALNKGNGPEAKRLMGQLEAIDPIGFQNAQSGAGRAGAMETQAGIAGNRFNADYYGIGPTGQPIPGAPMIDGQPVGFKGGLGATLTNRLAVANAVDAMKPQLMSSIDAAAKVGAIGPVGGRWTTFEQLAGDPDPEAQYLWGQMKSFTSLMPALHAMRSAELAQYLDKASGGLKQKPESLKAYFNGLGSVTEPMSTGINATRYTTPKAGGNQPAQGGTTQAGKPDYVYVPGKGLVKQ